MYPVLDLDFPFSAYGRFYTGVPREEERVPGKQRMREAKEKRILNGTEFIPEWSKRVVQYKDGIEIAIHNSIGEACKAVGCNDRRRLQKILNGRRGKSIYGFTFKYAESK